VRTSITLCATRGEGGESGTPPVCSHAELGTVRSQELACAVEALGGGRLDFLPYIDPLVGEGDTLYAFTDRVEELVEAWLACCWQKAGCGPDARFQR